MTKAATRDPGSSQLSLFAASDTEFSTVAVTPPAPDPDARARQAAVDPGQNIVLEASAGTGKTSVLVCRYINLLKAGVDPANILAIATNPFNHAGPDSDPGEFRGLVEAAVPGISVHDVVLEAEDGPRKPVWKFWM